MRKILQREGFEVFEAGNGPEALQLLKQKGPVNLLITDVLMPGMTGRELVEQVQLTDPHCGILYMSGFTSDTGVETGQFPPGSHFLQKPFTLGSLLRKANEVLASTPRRPA
jgi:CheY-like chemotaxis protein